jgi:hypothetical protein
MAASDRHERGGGEYVGESMPMRPYLHFCWETFPFIVSRLVLHGIYIVGPHLAGHCVSLCKVLGFIHRPFVLYYDVSETGSRVRLSQPVVRQSRVLSSRLS